MNTKTITQNKMKVVAQNVNDVVHGDLLVKDTPAPTVLIESENDLQELPPYPAGTIAYTAGFKVMWQLDTKGDWVSII